MNRKIILAAFCGTLLCTGCVTMEKEVRGDYAGPATGEQAVVHLLSGLKHTRIDLWISEAQTACQGFQNAGYLYDRDQRQLHPASAGYVPPEEKTLAEEESFAVARKIPAGQPLQLQASAESTKGFSTRCGPVSLSFLPEADRQYQAEFTWRDNSCTLSLSDVTDAQKPAPVKNLEVNRCRL